MLRIAHGLRDVVVDRLEQLQDVLGGGGVAVERLQRAHPDDRDLVPRELVLAEELAHLHLDELEELLIVDHVDLVEGDDDRRHPNLAGEQHVLAGLGHRPVVRRDDEDRPVDLRRTGDHVLDVVGVAGHVDVRVVAFVRLVLDVGDLDRDAARLLLGRGVDLLERDVLHVRVALVEDLGDRRGQGRLAVVNVTHRPDVDVGLRSFELLLGHWCRQLRLLWAAPLGPAVPSLPCTCRARPPACCPPPGIRSFRRRPDGPTPDRLRTPGPHSPVARATISRAIDSGTSW